jgi:hypothetical protein
MFYCVRSRRAIDQLGSGASKVFTNVCLKPLIFAKRSTQLGGSDEAPGTLRP